MINYSSIFLVALALSMDAFSVAITIGINCSELRKKLLFICLVGLCHFVFPWAGMLFGQTFLKSIVINGERILGIILLILALEMIYEYFHKEGNLCFTYPNLFLLIISVSMDSFMTGIGLYSMSGKVYSILTIFSLTSMLFSTLGIFLGNIFNKLIGKYSEVIGILILVSLGVKYFFF